MTRVRGALLAIFVAGLLAGGMSAARASAPIAGSETRIDAHAPVNAVATTAVLPRVFGRADPEPRAVGVLVAMAIAAAAWSCGRVVPRRAGARPLRRLTPPRPRGPPVALLRIPVAP